MRSYQSALTYWSAWLQLRYRRALGDGALPPEVAFGLLDPTLYPPFGEIFPPNLNEPRTAGSPITLICE
ncbi:hypothetical protein D3C81_1692440 [compost metagenome]